MLIYFIKIPLVSPMIVNFPPNNFQDVTSGSSGCKSQAYRPPHAAPSAPHVARPPKWPQRPGRCRGLGAQEKIDNRHVIKMSWHPVTSTVILFCYLSRAFSYLLSSESYSHTLWRLLIWHLFLQSTEVMFFELLVALSNGLPSYGGNDRFDCFLAERGDTWIRTENRGPFVPKWGSSERKNRQPKFQQSLGPNISAKHVNH